VSAHFPLLNTHTRQVGEDEEISIKAVADAILEAIGFKGEYTVLRLQLFFYRA